MPSWFFRAIFTNYAGLLAIGVVAGIAGILSFIVLKLCGLNDEKARAELFILVRRLKK